MPTNSSQTDAIKYLAKPHELSVGVVVALPGEEDYFKAEVVKSVRALQEKSSGEIEVQRLSGDEMTLADLAGALQSLSLFSSGPRMVVVRDADRFVKANRSALEEFLRQGIGQSILVLMLKSWPSNTKIAKLVAAEGGLTIKCDAPNAAALKKWTTTIAKQRMGLSLDPAALDLLIDLVPHHAGILEQEIAKLSHFVGSDGVLTPQVVHEVVGGWRVQQAWDMIDAMTAGDAPSALLQLERLMASGESAQALLPQIASTLRRFVAAGRFIEQEELAGKKPQLRQALAAGGIPPFKLGQAESQLKQLGRKRIDKILSWLLDCDLAIKGPRSANDAARTTLEELIVRMSRAAGAPARSQS